MVSYRDYFKMHFHLNEAKHINYIFKYDFFFSLGLNPNKPCVSVLPIAGFAYQRIV